MSQYDWIKFGLFGLAMFLLMWVAIRSITRPRPDVTFNDLYDIFPDEDVVTKENYGKGVADFSCQLRDEISSVIYLHSARGEEFRETLDILVSWKNGMIMDFTDGELVKMKRTTGGVRFHDNIKPFEQRAAKRLLQRVQTLAHQE